jgi:hypothetical protein
MNLQVVSLTQLGITNQQLCTTITMLHIRQSPRIVIVAQQGGSNNNNDNNNTGEAAFASSNAGLLLERKSPPGYEESQMIAATRQRNLRKRASALGGLNNAPPPPPAGVSESLNLNHLHHSPSTLSLPAELAGEESYFGGRAAAAGKEDFDNNNNNLFTATPPTLADAMSDRSSYHGRTRRSLPAELAGDAPRGRRAEMDSDRLSVAPTLVGDDGDDDDGTFPDRSRHHVRPGFSAPSGLGRARSRRWLEAHCAGG